MARRILENDELAEDMAQGVILTFLEYKAKHGKDSKQAVVYAVYDSLRKYNPLFKFGPQKGDSPQIIAANFYELNPEENSEMNLEISPDEVFKNVRLRNEHETIFHELKHLFSDSEWRVFEILLVRDYTVTEVAKKLKISIARVCQASSSAKKKMRSYVAAQNRNNAIIA